MVFVGGMRTSGGDLDRAVDRFHPQRDLGRAGRRPIISFQESSYGVDASCMNALGALVESRSRQDRRGNRPKMTER